MENRFKVIYTGELQPYVSAQEAVRSLAAMFKLSEDSVRALVLGGRAQEIKTDLDRATAERYLSAFSKAGLSVRIEPMSRPKTELHLSPLSAEDESVSAHGVEAGRCPKCGANDVHDGICRTCGAVTAMYLAQLASKGAPAVPPTPAAKPRDSTYAPPKAAVEPETAPPRQEVLDGPHSVPTGHGWGWIGRGFQHFKANPWAWMLVTVTYGVIIVAMSLIPFLGQILPYLLAPLFAGGLMLGARAQGRGEPLEFHHLFAGFTHHAGQLLTAGVLYLGLMVLAVAPFVLAIGVPVFSTAMGWEPGLRGDPSTMTIGTLDPEVDPRMILLAGLATALLVIPAAMAYWFAPTLIAIDGIKAWPAMKLSFMGCAKNVLPFLIYGLAATVLIILGALPFLLGLLVVIPTLTASMYVSYRDIFYGRV